MTGEVNWFHLDIKTENCGERIEISHEYVEKQSH